MGDYIDVDGVKTWFDTWGSGPPLVLMHGGMGSNASMEPLALLLAEHFKIFAPERRGHGHTPDVDGPITFALMMQDLVAFLDVIVGEPAHLVGWSDGANLALMLAMQYPERVRKLVPISANYDLSGVVPEALEVARSATADGPEFALPRSRYESMSPDGAEHWPIFFEKVKAMWMAEPNIDPKELGDISAPTLVIAADDDMVRMEHTADLYRSIPNSQLAIVPGTSHYLVLEQPGALGALILDFLLNDPAPTMMPIRRHSPDA